MRSDRTPITVVSGNSAPVAGSELFRVVSKIQKNSLFKRIVRVRWALFAMALAAIIGGSWLCLSMETLYQARAVVKLPVPFKVSSQKLLYFGVGYMLRNGLAPAHDSAVEFSSWGTAPMVVTVTAISNSSDNALSLANAAAVVARNQDNPFWNHILIRDNSDPDDSVIALGMPHLSAPATLVVDAAKVPVTNTHFLWRPENEVFAGIWVGILFLFGIIACAISPDPNRVSKARQARREMLAHLKVQFTPAANSDVDIPSSETLKVIAGIELVPDLTSSDSRGIANVRPVILDVSSELWSIGENQNDGKELLFLRSRSSTVGSRAAVLAIGRAFARRGIKTAMVDADITATLAKRDEFGFPEEMPGLLDILTRRALLSECLLEDEEYPGLTGICAGVGDVADGEADMFVESAAMLNLLDYLGEQNEIVLIHGPCGLDAGAVTLAKRAGATLIVGPEERSRLDDSVEGRALVSLALAQAHVLGRIEISRHNIQSTQLAI